jgi:hypothetical protein
VTTARDILHLTRRIQTSCDTIETRLPHATHNITLHTADGYPTTASGRVTDGSRGSSELTPTEAAAHTNLGDLTGYDTTYRPGHQTRLEDIAIELQAALHSLDRAHQELTRIGVPPTPTQGLRCPGINATGCTNWKAKDHDLCIDCGRITDDARRARRAQTERLRRHAS